MKSKALMLVAAMAAIGAIPPAPPTRPPRLFTSADEERLAKAEAKRQRKAAKAMKRLKP